MATELDLTIGFQAGGNSLGFLGGGWARAEPEFTWATGGESHLILQKPLDGSDYILTLDVVPFVHDPKIPSQRLTVSVNDTEIGSNVVIRPSILGYRIPGKSLAGGARAVITLLHPDAARPIDVGLSDDPRHLALSVTEAKLFRVLPAPDGATPPLPAGLMLDAAAGAAFPAPAESPDLAEWVLQRTGLSMIELAMQFESLGENCEFGLFQRRCDAEPLGLLRFSSTFLRNLIRGLDNGFDGLGDPDEVDPRLEGDDRKEFMIHEKRYGLVYHTFVYEGQRSVWLMKEQESARLKFLRRKFMEELEVAEKIFVYKRNTTVPEQEIIPLLQALNRQRQNTLLWVVPEQPGRPSGTVEVLTDGLLKGYIDQFAPDENAHGLSFDSWVRVCTNAIVLAGLRGQSFGPRATDAPP